MKKRHSTKRKARLDLDLVFGGIALMALHEADSLHGHAVAVRERVRVARDARNMTQLLREQRELAVRTRRRMRENHGIRRELWAGLLQDLRVHVGA